MSKIIKIENNILFIGMDDGTIIEVDKNNCSGFTPELGINVDVYKSESSIIVTEKNKIYKNENLKDSQKLVSKLTYCLWCGFLGGFGAHKFYAGNTGLGILYLLFCWTYIPAIISIIELIVALCKHSDCNGKIII